MRYYLLFISAFLWSCNIEEATPTLFTLLDNVKSGITFENNLTYDKDFNVYKYRNFYNGGGVAIGDINNDNLPDIYFTSNQGGNHLYLNKGDFTFENISESSGTQGTKAWSTGVNMVDINGDGHLDIYVCNSGDVKGDNKENELFINNGDLTFTESATEYGLNDKGFSTHASFFDYDKDGDLDVYLLNNSFQAIGSFNLRKNERPNRDELGGDKLLKNENGKFVDVSEEAGIYGSVIGFGLGVSVGDVNNDGWDDIFVSNDFFERDYLYLNQQDGTFDEQLMDQMNSISGASMGADIADINNDGNADIFVTEMLPSDYERLKTVTTFESWDKYQYNVKNGYGHQFTRNVLHLNNGNDSFSEISRLAGVSASDWSWGALFFDMDNDGWKDLFIANGIYRDLTNQDYLQYVANESVIESIISEEGVNYKELIDIIPSNPVPNHSYHNNGGIDFSNFTNSGLNTLGFSNGSAYGDLDNDGDLDLVVNNVNMPPFIYRNNGAGNNFIKIKLKGATSNESAIGARITVKTNTQDINYQVQPARGFQSSVECITTIGVGQVDKVDVMVTWPDGNISTHSAIHVNQTIEIKENKTTDVTQSHSIDAQPALFALQKSVIPYKHNENKFVDFNRERLVYHMHSTEGPHVAQGDVDGDGLLDIVIPGPKGQATSILIQNKKGAFVEITNPELERMKSSESVVAHLFDADSDGDLDLYVANGGVENSPFSPELYDALFINDGSGNYSNAKDALPLDQLKISTHTVVSSDMDQDGDQDLFIGERVKIGEYGKSGSGHILINDGNGTFENATSEVAPDLSHLGMITDAVFTDINNDKMKDLVVVGEYMSPKVFINENGTLRPKDIRSDTPLSGWWNRILATDFDNDGDIDFLLGNHGTNSRFKASTERPIVMYYSDFDDNGTEEGILTYTREDGRHYPMALRHSLIDQIKSLKKKFPDYKSFKEASIEDIFSMEQLEKATTKTVDQLETILLRNDGNMQFSRVALPQEVQFSPIYALHADDYDKDGDVDLLMGGNLYGVQPEIGIYDASHGVYLENNNNQFSTQRNGAGFHHKGEMRDIISQNDNILVFSSNDSIRVFHIQK